MPGPEPTASFAAALKQSPEEWTVFVNDVPRREAPTTNRPVHYAMDTPLHNGEAVCSSVSLNVPRHGMIADAWSLQFVLPSTQTFPLGQAIPFHLQLSLSSHQPAPIPASPPNPPLTQRRPQTAPSRRPSRSPTPHTRTPSRPSTAPSPATNDTLLSLFANPTFGAPPRGRRRALTAIVGLGEGIAGDGAMAFGDPRDRNMGRHPGGISGDSTRQLMDDVNEEAEVLAPNFGRGRGGAGRAPAPSAESIPRRPATATAATRTATAPRQQRPATSSGPNPSYSFHAPASQKGDNVSYIRVFLQRQIVVTVKGQKVVKTIACGDGK